ncbi:uncharacterized protein METZ01_LOCUS234376 [marine metagenome]|jgi:hypothetical protein|uniref:Uncharacterized protein n=1 Tax=marine metagenome TaxID=408172 RepID=A0A382H2Y4_9ZZZZ
MAFDEWIERAHGLENHAPHPKKKVEIRDTREGYFLTVSRGGKVIENRGPSVSLRYIMKHALEHCGFDDEPKMPSIVDKWEVTNKTVKTNA